jgi:hypothetical protein
LKQFARRPIKSEFLQRSASRRAPDQQEAVAIEVRVSPGAGMTLRIAVSFVLAFHLAAGPTLSQEPVKSVRRPIPKAHPRLFGPAEQILLLSKAKPALWSAVLRAAENGAPHRDRVEHEAHRVDGRSVGGDLVAAADPAGGGERRRLSHADQLQREVAVGLCLGGLGHGAPAGYTVVAWRGVGD